VHGYGAARLAIWMLFHPYRPKKIFGITIWPQGMIPPTRVWRNSIGNAVGNELVSQDTVFDALFETGFFANKVEGFVTSYTSELLSTAYPSLIEALPSGARAPVLDTISALQLRLAEHIASVLKSDQTAQAIETFVDRQVDKLLERRLEETVSADDRYTAFVHRRPLSIIVAAEQLKPGLLVRQRRIDDLARTDTTLAEMRPRRSRSSKSGSISRCRRSFITSRISPPARTRGSGSER
jgi:hypothetical protein